MNDVLITFPGRSVAKARRHLANEGAVRWLYLGTSYVRLRVLEEMLGNGFTRIDIARLHEDVAHDLKTDYVRWIDALNRKYGGDPDWWYGPVSSRNVYYTKLFQCLCYLEVLDRLADGNGGAPQLIVVESLGLARAVQRWARAKHVAAKIVSPATGQWLFMKNVAISFLQWFQSCCVMALRWISARGSMLLFGKGMSTRPLDVIVDMYAHRDSFVDDGSFKDRYFPGLLAYLDRQGAEICVHPNICKVGYSYWNIYKKIRRSSTPFIVMDDYLRPTDYLKAMLYPLRAVFKKWTVPPLRGHDLQELAREETWETLSSSGPDAVLMNRFYARLGKKGMLPKTIIRWYENQTLDKAMIAGVRSAPEASKIVGVQMFVHSANYLSLYPISSEVEARLAPDVLLETSEYQCQRAASYTHTIVCKPAAALRYAYLFEKGEAARDLVKRGMTILVVPPYGIDEGIEMLDMVRAWLRQSPENVSVKIKVHPDHVVEDYARRCGVGVKDDAVSITHMNMRDALDSASIVISSNSSAMVEAAARGVPLIIMGRQTTLNMNPLEDAESPTITQCYSADELSKAIETYRVMLERTSNEDLQKIGASLRNRYFTETNELTLRPFLDSAHAIIH